jgi:hypothetical protein
MLLARLRQSVAGLATAARRNPRPLAALQTHANYPLRKYATAEKIRHREGTYSLTTLPSGLRIATEDTGYVPRAHGHAFSPSAEIRVQEYARNLGRATLGQLLMLRDSVWS